MKSLENTSFSLIPSNASCESSVIESGLNVSHYSEKASLSQYIKKINQFPILSEEEEKFLLQDFFENQNNKSGHIVLNSHLRLVVKIAMQYKKFHASLMDLIAEGNLGLLKALKNFNLKKEVRFSTYAMLWIKASIREFLLKSLSSVKVATTSMQKKILFNLAKARKFLGFENKKLNLEEEERLAKLLNVERKDIQNHERMIYETKETSLNDLQFSEESSEKGEFISIGNTLEESQIDKNSANLLQQKLNIALNKLSKREMEIVKFRIINPEKFTLAELSLKFNVSKERIRQIQESALKKLKKILQEDEENLTFLNIEKIDN
jgi:RNA polymerase sigma-32 factor